MGNIHVAANTQVSWRVESGTFGNGSGAQQWLGLIQEFTPDESVGVTPIRYVGGGGRNVDMFLSGTTAFSLSIPYLLQTGKIWEAAWGSPAVSGSPNYLHTLSESGNLLPSFEVEVVAESTTSSHINRTFRGCTINSLTVEGNEGEPIKATLDVIAQSSSGTANAKTSVSADADRPFQWANARLTISGGGIASGTIDEMKSFTFVLNNNLEVPHYGNNSVNIGQPVPTNRDYEFQFAANMAWATGNQIYTKWFRGGSTFNCDLTLARNTGSDYINFAMSGCRCADTDVPIPNEGVIEQKIVAQPTTVTATVRDNSRGTYPFETIW